MHETFSSTISSWQNFYMLAGTASATLIGLLFVAVSLHIDLVGEAGASTILGLARRTFLRFIMIVMIALLFLVPHQDRLGLGLPLLALGMADTGRTLRVARDFQTAWRRRRGETSFMDSLLLTVMLPIVSGVGLIAVSATIVAGSTDYLYWMVPIVAVILVNAASNAWDLMLGLAKYKSRRAVAGSTLGGEAAE